MKSKSPRRALSPARSMAFGVLRRVETEQAYAGELLYAQVGQEVSARDAALATEIVMGTLRWQGQLDWFIKRYTNKDPAALDSEVRIALRLGIYQLRHLQKIPAPAAVNESVELVKQARKKSAAALVNAVLRRAAADAKLPLRNFLPTGGAPAERLAICHSHPAWLVKRWLEQYGEQRALALLAANNSAPAVACATVAPGQREQIAREWEAAKIRVEAGKLLASAMIVRGGQVAKTRAFQNGQITIQDEASQIIPLLLETRRGNSVLDLCAAPGGKTITLAQAAGPHALVTATDRYEHRLRKMRERLVRSGIENVSYVALDGTAALPFRVPFDRVLVDAPCSGTGTLSRNPEIRWRLKPAALAELHERQVRLLLSAMGNLAPGGSLLYSTCSLEREENEAVVQAALAACPAFRPGQLTIPPGVLAAGVSAGDLIGADGYFRTFPSEQHTDGFFAARLERK